MVKFKFSELYKQFAKLRGANYNLDEIKTGIIIDGDIHYISSDGNPTYLPKEGFEIVEGDD